MPLTHIADRLGEQRHTPRKLYLWSASQGLRESGGNPVGQKTIGDPTGALAHAIDNTEDAIYLMLDIHRHYSPVVTRLIRDCGHAVRNTRKSIVFLSPSYQAPPELQNELNLVVFGFARRAADRRDSWPRAGRNRDGRFACRTERGRPPHAGPRCGRSQRRRGHARLAGSRDPARGAHRRRRPACDRHQVADHPQDRHSGVLPPQRVVCKRGRLEELDQVVSGPLGRVLRYGRRRGHSHAQGRDVGGRARLRQESFRPGPGRELERAPAAAGRGPHLRPIPWPIGSEPADGA